MTQESTKPICRHEECQEPVYARAQCKKHYQAWMYAHRRAGGTIGKMPDSWAMLVAAMPGTCNQLVGRTGLHYSTVVETIRKKHLAGEIHKSSHLAPRATLLPGESGRGRRWTPIYSFGPGKDHKVSKRQKHAQMRAAANAAHKARKASKEKAAAAPALAVVFTPKTTWNLAFFNPANIPTKSNRTANLADTQAAA